ncbi:MAG: tripartite tricarboxylate transporter substrate binding protein [Hyphomonadaceae bacterium]|jgi:tripartite-type tricarboxylate transporter receptor subunit TctC|nr:tripartite tricarboxylate transporter substrate binding protein [Hyphomonadaceae bacterium]
MDRLKLYAILGALALFGIPIGAPAHAQTFPTKPVTLIVPWPAGGSSDLALRAFADAAQKHLGQQIIIENRPGASGTLGPAQMAATSKPDGYTIAQMPITVFRLPYMTKTTFDPTKDFTYVAGLTGYTFGVVVQSKSPWKTFKELIDYAKANPGKIKYGTPGTGTSLHIGMEQIAKQAGVRWTQVPFKGAAETNAALLGGHVDAVADSTGWRALVDSGDFRLLATWGGARTKNWPDVPTLTELGIPLVANSPYGIAGPKGMDPKVVQILHDAFAKAVREPVYLEALRKFDQELAYLNTADYEKHAAEQIEEAKRLVADLGLKTN